MKFIGVSVRPWLVLADFHLEFWVPQVNLR
jgi:hypothetical protein